MYLLCTFKVVNATVYFMNEFKNTGGAKIGIVKSSWPFADLTVNRNKFELNVSLIGKLAFLPGDIKAISPHPGGYKMRAGIKIEHRIPHYKDEILFWSYKSPAELIQQITATGFMANTDTMSQTVQAEVRQLQAQGGFAMKRKPLIMILVLWLAIIIYGAINVSLTGDARIMMSAIPLAFSAIILFSIATLLLPSFAHSVLKPGYTAADVKKFLIFLIIISLFVTVISGISATVI